MGDVVLPIFDHRDWESHVSKWTELESKAGMLRLEKGAVVDSLERHHGEASVAKFAHEVGAHPGTLYGYAQVYRRLQGLEVSLRDELVEAIDSGHLSYTHVKRANSRIADDVEFVDLMKECIDNEWSSRRLMIEMDNRRKANVSEPPPPPEEEHAPHGETGPWSSDDGEDDDIQFHGGVGEIVVDVSTPSADACLLSEYVRELCMSLKETDPDWTTIGYVRTARESLEQLESELAERLVSVENPTA